MNQSKSGKTAVVLAVATAVTFLLLQEFKRHNGINESLEKLEENSFLHGKKPELDKPKQESGASHEMTLSVHHQLSDEHSEQNPEMNPQHTYESNADLWFASKEELAELATKRIAIQRKGNCSHELTSATDFNSFMQDTFGFPAKSSETTGEESDLELKNNEYALRSHVLQTSLFIKQNPKFLQINAQWNGNHPPTYRIEAYSFDNKSLSSKPESIKFAEFESAENYDIESVRTTMQQLQQSIQRKGNIAQKLSRFDGATNRVAYFFEAVPLTYEGSGEECSVQVKTLTALCFCQFTERDKGNAN